MTTPQRRLPAEWEPQSGVLLAWPHEDTDWAPWLPAVETTYTDLVAAITRHQPALVLCRDAAHEQRIRARLGAAGVDPQRLRFARVPYDDTWTRDYGPLTVLEDGRPRLLDFAFDGWGGKYDAVNDDAVTARLQAAGTFADVPVTSVREVLEGGSIESDGQGTILSTTRCQLARPWRDPGPDGIAARLQAMLGARRVLWLTQGHLEGDDTDGHIDTLARFCDPHTIAHVRCDDPGDTHFTALAAMASELAALRTLADRPYRLVPLPWPRPCHGPDGRRLPATYANFLIINGAVLVPTYDDPADAVALDRLAACFPERRVIGIPCAPLIQQNGSLHCITMQLPRGVLPA